MLKVDPVNLICTIANLLILFVALRIFLFKPVQKIIEARQAEADKKLAEAEAVKAEAAALKEQYAASIADAESEKQQIVAQARKDADAQYEKIVEAAKEKAKETVDNAVADAQAKREQILKDTEKDIADCIVSAAGKIVGSKSGEEIDKSLYDEFLVKAGDK